MDYVIKVYKDWKFHSQKHDATVSVHKLNKQYQKFWKNSLAEQFFWRGTADKIKIQGLTTTLALRNAFNSNFEESEETFNFTCKSFFQYAKDRQNKKKKFTEIIPDMDDMDMFNEKQSIRDSARSLKKYGSTCNHIRNSSSEVLIRHEIEQTDTLQGISLKYGCTMEQIRRANRLFASDSLFLRQYLLIPVEKSSPYYPKDDRPQSLPARAFYVAGTEFESPNQNLLLQLQNTTSKNPVQNYNNNQNMNYNNNSTNSSSRSIESIVMSPEEENKRSIDEFLDKIDTTIAESKKYVAKSQHSSNDMLTSQSNNDLFSSNYQAGNSTTGSNSNIETRRCNYQQPSSSASTSCSSSVNHHIRHSSSGSTSDTAHLLNLNQGKRVQSSLQRLEKQQDEFFEL